MDPQNILNRTASAVCPSCEVSRPLQEFLNGEHRVYNVCKGCLTTNQPSWFIYEYPTTRTRPSWFTYIRTSISFCIVAAVALITSWFRYTRVSTRFRFVVAVAMTTLLSSFAVVDLSDLTAKAKVAIAISSVFVYRNSRLGVNIVRYLAYKPSPIPAHPSYNSRDVSVLLPVVKNNPGFIKRVRCICVNNPAYLFVIATGQELRDEIDNSLEHLRNEFPTVNIQLPSTDTPNKRRQIDSIIPLIQTRLTCMVDATVILGPRFFNSALAPLQDPDVCLVGTNKRVQHNRNAGMFESFWNFVGWLYVQRHNFESRAQNTIKGEVFAIAGRANVVRTAIIQDPNFRIGYMFTNERFFLNKYGPLAADDDNFIVRWVLKQGGGIRWQHDNDARIDIVSIGEFPFFVYQSGWGYLYRWSTSPLRSLVYTAVTSLSLLLGPFATDNWVQKLLVSYLCYFFTRAVFKRLRLDKGTIYICLRSVYRGLKPKPLGR